MKRNNDFKWQFSRKPPIVRRRESSKGQGTTKPTSIRSGIPPSNHPSVLRPPFLCSGPPHPRRPPLPPQQLHPGLLPPPLMIPNLSLPPHMKPGLLPLPFPQVYPSMFPTPLMHLPMLPPPLPQVLTPQLAPPNPHPHMSAKAIPSN